MMASIIEPGYYINLFRLIVPEREIQIMVGKRSEYPDLKELREEIKKNEKEIFVYAPAKTNKLFGYGNDMGWLSHKDFRLETISLYDEPRLASRMIIEGFINRAREIGYIPQKIKQNMGIQQILDKNKGRLKVYNHNKYKLTSNNQVKIFMGYDVRVIFLKDPIENKLNFGLIVDVTYSIKDINDNSLKPSAIASKFGSGTLKEVRQIQKDLIPTGINREVSRQRLIEDIIPFVEQIKEIDIACGLKVEVNSNPCRIVIGGEDEVIW